jgi:hypothetical protein
MAIDIINDGEAASSVRKKLNLTINEANKVESYNSSFQETLIFRDLETFEFTKPQSFKITEVLTETGITASIKLHDTTTDYTLEDTVSAFDRLDISVDVTGAITIKGELV